jgi:ABC-type multidrug transport system fused ATPase/permease subunit
MQEPLIFNYTIGENILYSKLDCHNDEIVQVAEDANALDFVRDQKEREEHDDKPDAMLERLA